MVTPASPRWIISRFLVVVMLVLFALAVSRGPIVGDFIAYWSASRIVGTGGNPYDPDAIHALQLTTGWGQADGVQVWNPPWTPVILLPLGLLPMMWARAIWATGSVIMLWTSGYWLMCLYWPRPSRLERLLALTMPTLFVHSWVALNMGQITPLVLFGLAGSLYLYRRRPYLSGVMLVLATVKPQLCLGALVLMGLRALVDREWRFIGGAGVGLSSLLVVLSILRPTWIIEYQSVFDAPLVDWQTPTLATFIREVYPVFPVAPFFLTLGGIALLLLVLWSLRTRRWDAAVPAAVVATMLFAIFGWSFDQIVLLIPTYHVLGQVRRWRSGIVVVAILLVAINVLALRMRAFLGIVDEFNYFWIVPAFTIVYLVGLAWPRLSGRMRASESALQLNP